jgi:hypothetical protein
MLGVNIMKLVWEIDSLSCIFAPKLSALLKNPLLIFRVIYPSLVRENLKKNLQIMKQLLEKVGITDVGVSFLPGWVLPISDTVKMFAEMNLPIYSVDIPDKNLFDWQKWYLICTRGFKIRGGLATKLKSGFKHAIVGLGYLLYGVGTQKQWSDTVVRLEEVVKPIHNKKIIRWISGEIMRWGSGQVDKLMNIIGKDTIVVVEYHYFYHNPEDYFRLMLELIKKYPGRIRLSFDASHYEMAHRVKYPEFPGAVETLKRLVNLEYQFQENNLSKEEWKLIRRNISSVEYNEFSVKDKVAAHACVIDGDVDYRQILYWYGKLMKEMDNSEYDDYPKIFMEVNPLFINEFCKKSKSFIREMNESFYEGYK